MSSEIKNAIGSLCKLMNLLYGSDLKPEHFRLAKFNKTDDNVVTILWDNLGTILDEKNRTSIQRKLQNLKYNRKEFFALSVENTSGSRELVLALVFLTSYKIEQDLDMKLDRSLSPVVFGQTTTPQIINEHEKFHGKKLGERDLGNYRSWLQGKIISNSNMLFDYKKQIDKIQQKYIKILDMKAHNELTVYEILALKNKKIGEQFLQESEDIVCKMSVYVEWTKREKHFWKWMNTVVDEARNNSQ